MWYEQYFIIHVLLSLTLTTEWTWVSRPINSIFFDWHGTYPGHRLATTWHHRRHSGGPRHSGFGGLWAAMGSKLGTLIAGQAALESKVYILEIKVDSNTTQINDIIQSVDFESVKIHDNVMIMSLKSRNWKVSFNNVNPSLTVLYILYRPWHSI